MSPEDATPESESVSGAEGEQPAAPDDSANPYQVKPNWIDPQERGAEPPETKERR